MLVVEAFTGKTLLKEWMNAVAVFCILHNDWSKMLKNAQVVGFSSWVWGLLGVCWHGYHPISQLSLLKSQYSERYRFTYGNLGS